MKKRVLVILSGCGVRDGSEIHEAVVTLLALDRAGADIICTAPNIPSTQCVDHFRGVVTKEVRNVLTEAARIARGRIIPLSQVSVNDLDAIVVPGGLGAATNLCNFAITKGEVVVESTMKQLLLAAHAAHKPIGFLCISPVIAASLFGQEGLRYTVGNDATIQERLATTGAVHVNCASSEVVVDEKLKILTTPAYMLATRISEIELGISKLINELLKMA